MNIEDIVSIEDITGIESIEGDELIIHHMTIDDSNGVYIVPIAGITKENSSVVINEESHCLEANNKPNFSMESLKSTIHIRASIIYPYGFKIININSKVTINNKFNFTYVIDHGILTIRYTKCKS